jgi:hypothetical protein
MTWKPRRTCISGSSLCNDEELAWWFVTCSSGIGKWGQQHKRSSKVLPCRVKVQGLALIGCAWQPCWRHCFASEDFLQGENLWSMIGQRRRLCTISFLKASLLEKLDFLCCFGGGCTTATRNRSL